VTTGKFRYNSKGDIEEAVAESIRDCEENQTDPFFVFQPLEAKVSCSLDCLPSTAFAAANTGPNNDDSVTVWKINPSVGTDFSAIHEQVTVLMNAETVKVLAEEGRRNYPPGRLELRSYRKLEQLLFYKASTIGWDAPTWLRDVSEAYNARNRIAVPVRLTSRGRNYRSAQRGQTHKLPELRIASRKASAESFNSWRSANERETIGISRPEFETFWKRILCKDPYPIFNIEERTKLGEAPTLMSTTMFVDDLVAVDSYVSPEPDRRRIRGGHVMPASVLEAISATRYLLRVNPRGQCLVECPVRCL